MIAYYYSLLQASALIAIHWSPRGAYFDKLLGILLKQAKVDKVDGCKSSLKERIR
jgi:hypothetical protein